MARIEPFPNGVFSPEFIISHRANFHMSSTHRALIEALPKSEFTNAMLEMATWTTSMAWYLREFADCRGVEHVQDDLYVENKTLVDLRARWRPFTWLKRGRRKSMLKLNLS